MDIRVYADGDGFEPYTQWVENLRDRHGKSRVFKAIAKMESGLFGLSKSVGEGVQEYKIEGHGPGYRIYFGFDGPKLVVLLGGSDKHDQKKEIKRAKEYWKLYKKHKRADESTTKDHADENRHRHNREGAKTRS